MKLRKYLALLLSFLMLFSLTACGGDKEENESPSGGEVIERSEGLRETETTAAEVVEEDTGEQEVLDWWEGQWYGWWMIFDGDGYYADYITEAYDCCMVIEPFEGKHLISIWDEDFNDYESNCLAEVLVEIEPDGGNGAYGRAVSVDDEGSFFWYGSIGQGDWSIDPEYAGVDNMLIIEGAYTDEDGEYCEYGVVLTKWGYEWNEEDSTYPPDYYESYFLPLMEEGEDLPIVFEP